MTEEQARSAAIRDLEGHLSKDVEPILLNGPIGIGKSFVAKQVVAEALSERQGLGVFSTFKEELAGDGRGARCIEIVAPQSGLGDWADVMEAAEVELPGGLTPAMLLSPPRQLKSCVRQLMGVGALFVLIFDRYDDRCRHYLAEADFRALAELKGPSFRLILETRDLDFPLQRWPEPEGQLLRLASRILVPAPARAETRTIARETWQRLFSGNEQADVSPVEDQIVERLLSRTGRHPGTLLLLIQLALQRAKLEDSTRGAKARPLDWIETAGRETALEAYLQLRWEALQEDERYGLVVVALADKIGRLVKETLKLWVRAHGDPSEGELTLWQNVLRNLGSRFHMLEGKGYEVNVSGDLLREFVCSRPEARRVLDLTGLRLPSRAVLDWDVLLVLWLLGILVYLVLSFWSWIRPQPLPWLIRILGWLPGFGYAIWFGLRRLSPAQFERIEAKMKAWWTKLKYRRRRGRTDSQRI
jgi:hypothetical protein